MKINSFPTFKIILLIVIILTGLIYIKTSSFGFVNWDDDENIRTNVRYKELSYDNIKFHFHETRYKALAIWSFMADNALFGKKVSWYHIHNVFLHLINVLLVFLLTLRLTKKETIALFTAALFALHPVFVEPVAWVTGRKDLLFVLYSLLAVLAYIKYLQKQQNVLWLLIVAIFIYFSSLAKIQAFTLPPILLGLDWFYSRKISFTLFAEKLMFFALIFDIWIICGFLICIIVFIDFYNKYYSIKFAKNAALIFLYLLSCLLIITLFSSHLILMKKTYMYLFPYIFITLFLFYGFVSYLGFRKKPNIISKILSIKIYWKIIIIISAVLVYSFEIYNKFFFDMNFAQKVSIIQLWSNQSGLENNFSFLERLILAPNAFLYYCLRFFLISPQNPMIAYPEHSADGSLPTNMITTAIFVYLFFAAILLLVIRYFKKNKVVMLGLIWFLASISIVMHIIPIEGRVLVGDRYAYPAYIGLFLIIGSVTDFLLQRFKKNYVYTGMVVITVILSIITFINQDTWKNSTNLWQKALKVTPENHYAMYSLSLAYFVDEKKPEKALQYLDNAIKIKEHYQYYNNRGRIKYALNDFYGALADINKSILLDSNSFSAYNNRGAIQQQLANFKSAFADFDKAIKLKPNFSEAINNRTKAMQLIIFDSIVINNLFIAPEKKTEVIDFIQKTAQVYINNKDFVKASVYLTKGIAIEPTNQTFHETLAVMYQLNNNYDKSMEAYNKGLFYLPANPTLIFGRGLLYLAIGDTVKACADISFAAAQGYPDAENVRQQICGK